MKGFRGNNYTYEKVASLVWMELIVLEKNTLRCKVIHPLKRTLILLKKLKLHYAYYMYIMYFM